MVKNWIIQRNLENMVEYYRIQLKGLLVGESIINKIPKGTRETLHQYGVLTRFGSKYELTNYGIELLQKLTA